MKSHGEGEGAWKKISRRWHGFRSWVFLEKWLGRHSVIKRCSRAYAALWQKEGLVDVRFLPALLSVLLCRVLNEDLCCFLWCFGNELQNAWLLTYRLKCSVSRLIAKSVHCHSYLFFFIFSSVLSHCASLYLGSLSMCELFLKKGNELLRERTYTLSVVCMQHICLLLARSVAPILPVYMSLYSAPFFLVHLI